MNYHILIEGMTEVIKKREQEIAALLSETEKSKRFQSENLYGSIGLETYSAHNGVKLVRSVQDYIGALKNAVAGWHEADEQLRALKDAAELQARGIAPPAPPDEDDDDQGITLAKDGDLF